MKKERKTEKKALKLLQSFINEGRWILISRWQKAYSGNFNYVSLFVVWSEVINFDNLNWKCCMRRMQ
jgi:hypothetical protein